MKLEKILNGLGFATVADPSQLAAGQIAVANVAEGVPPVQFLTDFAVGLLTRSNMADTLNHIAPIAPVIANATNAAFQYGYTPLDEEFPSADYNKLVRAQGGDFPFTDSFTELRDGHIENVGVSIALENGLIAAIPGYRERAVTRLVEIINRATLVKAFAILDDIATEETIDVATDKNPDGTLRSLLHSAGNEAGFRPNRVLYGPGAWDMRTSDYDAQAPMSSAAFRAARSADELGRYLGVSILVPDGRSASADGTYPVIGQNKIYATIGFDGVSTNDPSTMKTFRPPHGITIYESQHLQGQKTILTASVWQAILPTNPAGALAITVEDSSANG